MRFAWVCAAVILTLQALASPLLAQRVALGVVVGGYANRDFDSRFEPGPPGFPPDVVESDSRGYVVGPAFEARLRGGLSVGVEALFKPLHYRDAPLFQDGVIVAFSPNTVVTWQFPVLARYKFSIGGMRPFVEGGPSFRSAGNLNRADPSHLGATAGVGIETEWRRLRFAPRVRYTRWSADPASAGVTTRRDQVELLAGFSYVEDSKAYPLGRRVSLGVAGVEGDWVFENDGNLLEPRDRRERNY